MRRLLLTLLLAAGLASCVMHHPMEDRAVKQITASMDYYLDGYFPGRKGWRMEDLKTVYVNDSLCILQCTVWIRDSVDQTIGRDYRYVYLLDMDFSRAIGKPVFAENFINTWCLSDQEIRLSRRDVRRTRENVYNTLEGGCIPIQIPFKEE